MEKQRLSLVAQEENRSDNNDNCDDDDDDEEEEEDNDDNEDEDDDIEETFTAHFFKIMKVIKATTVGILMILIMTSH